MACVSDLVLASLLEGKPNARYAYIAPFYGQAKQVAWDYLLAQTIPLGAAKNESELRVDLPNGARIRLYGADNADSLRGIYLDGVVLDEYADMRPSVWSQVIRPALSDRKGWATFIGTPKGRNEFCKLYEAAADDPEWMRFMLRASETGILPDEELAAIRKQLSSDQYDQEMECSFDAAIVGAYYGALLNKAEVDGRICRVPYDPSLPCETWWDLGMADPSIIWFVQRHRSEIRVIDYYEEAGASLNALAKVVDQKPYSYSRHIAPHDIAVRELGTGRSRKEVAASLGLKFVVAPNLPVDDGIEAVKMMLPMCWFDREKTAVGVESLRQYRSAWNEKMKSFASTPLHDFASHASDAFRMGAVSQKEKRERPEGVFKPLSNVSGGGAWMS